MRRYGFFIIISLNIVLSKAAIVRLNGDFLEGDACMINDRTYGTCEVVSPTTVSKCTDYFKDLLNKGQTVYLCGFKGRDSLVCCPEKINIETTTSAIRHGMSKVKLNLSYQNCVDQHLDLREEVDFLQYDFAGETYEKDYPGIAAIGWSMNNDVIWRCVGSLISSRFVITSCQCLNQYSINPNLVRLGDIDLGSSRNDEQTLQVQISSVVKHPNYKRQQIGYNIALIFLSDEVLFNRKLTPSCLPDPLKPLLYMDAIGYQHDSRSKTSNVLIRTSLKYQSKNVCGIDTFDKTNDELCVFLMKDRGSVCARAPSEILQSFNPEERDQKFYKIPTVVGIASFATSCINNTYELHTSVIPHIDWIQTTVNSF